PVFADTILAPGHTWEYTFTDPTSTEPNWKTTTGLGGIWVAGPAPFGNATGVDSNFDYVTYWPSDGSDGDDVWLRTSLNLTGFDLSSVTWDLGVDNGYKLYANGVLVGSGNAEGYTYRWEYSGGFAGNLVAGNNVIAVELEDHGGLTAFDMQITGNRVTTTPEPA